MQGCRKRGAGGGVFSWAVNPISTRGADYAHHSTMYEPPPGFSDLVTALVCILLILKSLQFSHCKHLWSKFSISLSSIHFDFQDELVTLSLSIRGIWDPRSACWLLNWDTTRKCAGVVTLNLPRKQLCELISRLPNCWDNRQHSAQQRWASSNSILLILVDTDNTEIGFEANPSFFDKINHLKTHIKHRNV